MLIKVFTITFDSLSGEFKEGPVRDFLKDKEIISVTDYLFVRNEIPYLVLVVKYYPYRPEIQADAQSSDDMKWKEMLSAEDMGLFNLLRDWRSERCKKDGVPPYIVMTNKQLAALTKSRPQSIAELSKIDGIGSKKTERYAVEILALTKLPNMGGKVESSHDTAAE